jgi:hypothetical protein
MEVGPGFAVSSYHCCKVRRSVYFRCEPVLYIWEELLCYSGLRTFIPLFLPSVFCLLFYFTFQRPFRDPVVADRSAPVSCSCFCWLICYFVSVCSCMGLDPREFYCLVGCLQDGYFLPTFFNEEVVVVDVL